MEFQTFIGKSNRFPYFSVFFLLLYNMSIDKEDEAIDEQFCKPD